RRHCAVAKERIGAAVDVLVSNLPGEHRYMIGRTGWSVCSMVTAAMFALAATPPPRQLIKAARPLTAAEVAAVVGAAQRALVGKPFRFSAVPGATGSGFLMGPHGRLRIYRMAGGIEGGMIVGGACASPPCPVSTPPLR